MEYLGLVPTQVSSIFPALLAGFVQAFFFLTSEPKLR